MDGRPNGGSRRLRGTFNSAVSCGRRRGEGATRPDTRKREEEAGWKEGGRDGRPNGGGRRLRGTSKSAVSCGRRRGEGGERPDKRKREDDEEEEEGI